MKSLKMLALVAFSNVRAQAFLSFVFCAAASYAAQPVDLAWDPSPDAGVSHYRVHYGTASGHYGQSTNAGVATTLTVQGLSEGLTYYFAVTAVGTNQLESEFSNEVNYTVPVPGNTAPTLTSIPTQTILEDGALSAVSFTVGDNETAPGSLTVTGSSSDTGLVPNGNIVFGGSGANRTVAVTPVANAFGSVAIVVTVSDGDLSTNTTFNLNISGVNDAPGFDPIANREVIQGSGPQTVTVTGIHSGAANESQTLSLAAISSNPSLVSHPAVTYSSPSGTGSLVFTPASGETGSATISVRVTDDAGTANGGNDTALRSFVVTVANAPNVAPTLNNINDVTITQAEGEPGLSLGVLGSGNRLWVVSAGGAPQSQVVALSGIGTGGESGQVVTVTASSSNPALLPDPSVSYSSPSSTGTLTLNPSVGSTGSAVVTVTVQDDGGGSNITRKSFSVTVNGPANTPPTVGSLADRTMNEDVSSGQLGVSVSDAQTSASSLQVSARSGNPVLISDAGLVFSGTGSSRSLTIHPRPDQSGKALITVRVTDGGGAVTHRAFWATVNPVNDAPTLVAPSDVVLSGTGIQVMELIGLGAGPLEVGQTLSVVASSSNPSVVAHPEVMYQSPDSLANLQLSPVEGASGTATITVTVRDDGGTARGGQDTLRRTFTVTSGTPIAAAAVLPDSDAVAVGAALGMTGPILQLTRDASGIHLSWDDATGPYRIQRNSNPGLGQPWETLNVPLEAAGGTIRTARVTPSASMEFFRLVRQ